MQKHTFSIQLGNKDQFGTPSTQICNLKVIHTVTRKSVFQLGDIITNSNNCTNNSSHRWLQMCSSHALFSFSPQGLSKVRNHSWKFLPSLLLALWYLWKLLTPFCLPKVSLPPPGSSLTCWKLPPHPLQCKVQGLAGWHVGRQGDLPHLAILPAVTPPPLEKGMGLIGGFSSGLYHTPGYHWSKQTGQRQNTPTKGII